MIKIHFSPARIRIRNILKTQFRMDTDHNYWLFFRKHKARESTVGDRVNISVCGRDMDFSKSNR